MAWNPWIAPNRCIRQVYLNETVSFAGILIGSSPREKRTRRVIRRRGEVVILLIGSSCSVYRILSSLPSGDSASLYLL